MSAYSNSRRRQLPWILLATLLISRHGFALGQVNSDSFTTARHRLVDKEIIASGITNRRVIEAIRVTPRHMIVPLNKRHLAYFDMAIPIGHQQTISPPFVVAFMTEQLDPQSSDRVLEIGTGSGYQAAVLSPLVRDVYTIEIVKPLGRRAATVLRRLGYENVHTKIGDGFQGWPEAAPFDKIIVTCSPENIPEPLVEQLMEEGRLVIPLGERFNQILYLFTKKAGELQREALQSTFFVPMTGIAEQQRKIKPEAPLTGLVHGNFENTIGNSEKPPGWYYVRQGRVEANESAPSGSHYLTFTNATLGRYAHALQAFGVDGREIRTLTVSLWVRGQDLRHGQGLHQRPEVTSEFYDALRVPVGTAHLGPWNGSFPWKQEQAPVMVPDRARLAVIGIGLFGATGTLSIDDVKISLSLGR